MTAAETPMTGRRELVASLVEGLLLVLLLVAAGLSLTASARPETPALGDFFRQDLIGQIAREPRQIVPWKAVPLAVAVLLLAQAALRVQPDVRAGTAGFGAFLILAPVLNYDGLVQVLSVFPEDAQILGWEVLDSFSPVLPVTWPLLVGAGVALLWCFVVPRDRWPASVPAFGLVTLWLAALAVWLNLQLVAARGQEQFLHYYQWPKGMAAAWMIAQAGAAATVAAASARQEIQSRVTAALMAVLLIVSVVLGGGQ